MKKFNNILTTILSAWPIIILSVLSIAILIANYVPGTYLIGWDNTVPELNLSLNFNRFIFGVWQEYRGLGTLDGMAHTANIIYWFYAALASLIVPTNLVRYVLQISWHFLGGLGMFFLLKSLIFPEILAVTKKNKGSNPFWLKLFSLLGACFYQYNLMTIQMFYVPLEVFSVHFAAIPWSIFTLVRFFKKPTIKSWCLLMIVNLLAIPQSHVPTVYISYSLIIGWMTLAFLAIKKTSAIKTIIILLISFFSLNAFWGLPYIYSALNKSAEISNSKINRYSTDDIFYRNFAWGDFKSVATFGGFNLDYFDWNTQTQKTTLQFEKWLEIYQSPFYQTFSLLLFFTSIFGFSLSLFWGIKKKSFTFFGLSISWLWSFSMLAVNSLGIGLISQLLRNYIPFFYDIFRFTFTKFSLVYSFSFAVLAAISIFYFVILINKHIFKWFTFIFFFGIVFYNSSPVFKGYFFYPELRHKIPQSYFDVSKYLNSQESNNRIAILPLTSFYGWTTNEWGYRGSGFLWQMIKQPMMDRAFDAWSTNNETFYLQLNQAISDQNSDSFYQILNKYQIEWILLDKTIFNPGDYHEALLFDQISKLLSNYPKVMLVQNNETLSLYRLSLENTSAINLPNKITLAANNHSTDKTLIDNFDSDFGSYIQKDSGIFYPFSFLTTELQQKPLQISNNNLNLSAKIPPNTIVDLPTFSNKQTMAYVDIYSTLNNKRLSLNIKPLLPILSAENDSNENVEFIYNTEILDMENLFVSIDDSIFQIHKKEHEYLGTIPLSLINPVSIKTFKLKNKSSAEATSLLSKQPVTDCWKDSNKNWYVDKKTNFGFQLISKNASACVSIPIVTQSKSLQKSNLFSISFDYLSKNGVKPDICIRKVGSFGCINPKLYEIYGNTTEWNNSVLLTMLPNNENLVVDFINRVNKENEEQSINYDNIYFSSYEELTTDFISLQERINYYDQKIASLAAQINGQLDISIPLGTGSRAITFENWLQNRGDAIPQNCDSLKRGQVSIENKKDARIYTAVKKASVCDYFPYSQLEGELQYLFHITGKNLQGVGIKGFIQNDQNKHRELTFTTGRGSFDIWQPFIPSTTNSDEGVFNLYLSAQSYGPDRNETELKKLEFIPLPLKWLTAIKLKPSNFQTTQNGKVNNTTKLNSTLYVSNYASESNGNLTLNQSFDQGWMAFIWPINKTKKEYLNLSTYTILNHNKYNGWANSWEIPPGEHKIIIFYWPQLLSYLGYILLLIPPAFLSVSLLMHKKRR
jgi:hypothetical protein